MVRKLYTFILLALAAAFYASAQATATQLTGDVSLMIGNDLGRNGYYEQNRTNG